MNAAHDKVVVDHRNHRRSSRLTILFFLCTMILCTTMYAQSKKGKPLFSLLSSKNTGINFLNQIEEDDSLNVFRYEYLYNGAGVGIADFNNDGWNDVFFSSNTSPNKLFINQKNFQFADISSAAGIRGNGTWSTGVSIADVNGDGLMDIYVCHSGKYSDPKKLSNELFINQGITDNVPVFKEMAAAYGLDAPGTQSTQAAFFDYDKDGDLDMFLLNHSNHTYNPFLNTRKIRATPDFNFGNRLFRCDKTATGSLFYTDVTLKSGIINNALNFGLSVTISDVNRDGWPDIYTTSDYTERDCFYINNNDGTFTDVLQKSLAHISKYSMGADIADYNNDGRPDIFTLDMLPEDNHRQKLLKGPDEYDQYHLLIDSGYYHQQMRNMLQLNEGTDDKGITRFSEIGQLAGVSNTDWSWSGLFADFDNDGWKDLFVSNGYLRDYTDMDFLKYTVADAMKESLKQGNVNFQTFDLVKKMPSNKLSNYIFHNDHDLRFSNTTEAWGLQKATISNAAAYADLDNDGDLDLIVCNNNEPALVYKNNQREFNGSGFIKLRFEGPGLNSKGYGVKVDLLLNDGSGQYQELYPVRGYQSTMSQELLFGIPAGKEISKLTVQWPGGQISTMENVQPDQSLVLKQTIPSDPNIVFIAFPNRWFFRDITDEAGLNFIHHENDFVDFKDEVLLPYQLSREGPALAKADVNGDGREDVFIGGAIGQEGKLYLQLTDGKFILSSSQPWAVDSASEDVSALFFDADKDGDMDLYVVSGGNEYGDGSPEFNDRIYSNDGKGNFSSVKALPDMLSSKKAIAAADFDNDGDLDLFIGGRGMPGSFPLASRSYLLRNDSKAGNILFTDITASVAPLLMEPGMVTVAGWADLDNDHFPELVIAGDWMSVMLFKNDNGKLVDASGKSGLEGLDGMWSALTLSDIDNDGDIDIILGNCGYNNQFKASVKEPLRLYAADFDDNGRLDPIVCYYIQGKSYPMASRDELLDQIVPLKKKYIRYSDYADAGIKDIFPADKLRTAKEFKCNQLASGILYNDGNMRFSFTPFPLAGQFSRVSSIVVDDLDKDGIKDLLIAGNYFAYRVQLGRADASLGLFLKGNADHSFKAIDPAESGCYIGGDTRSLVTVKDKAGKEYLVVGKNDGAVQVLKIGQ